MDVFGGLSGARDPSDDHDHDHDHVHDGWRDVRGRVTSAVRKAVLLASVWAILVVFVFAFPRVARADGTPVIDAGADASTSTSSRDAIDRETPRRSLQGFLRQGRDGNFAVAANYLDLRQLSASRRDTDGPELAQKLAYVLERRPNLDLSKVPDTPAGDPASKSPDTFVADTLYAGEDPIPIVLSRVRFADGVERWLVAASTVEAIPVIDSAYGPRSIGIPIPASLARPTFLGNELWQWIGAVVALFVAYGVARAVAAILVRAAMYFARRTPGKADDMLVESSRRPLRLVVAALVFRGLLGPIQLTTAVLEVAEHAVYSTLVVGVAWFILRALGVATVWLDEQAGRNGDIWHGRRIRTQATLLRRVASITVGFVASSFFLLQFEFVRSVGVSLLASAGVLGVVVGFAAQKSLAAIIGGIQFSVAQPVRMGDQVVVEGELGEVEEINLTYAVVRLWDKRRFVLPITYFLEKAFQNWTRTTTDIVGTVLFKVDVTASVPAVRAELQRICASEPLWDKQTCLLQVTDADNAIMTLRAAVSAEDATKLFELECNVRERMTAFLHPPPKPSPPPAPPAPDKPPVS